MNTASVKLLYDGQCPFCRREVDWLRHRDRDGSLVVEDISALGFDPQRYGLTRDEVNARLHAIRSDGTVVRGLEAVRAAYRAVGLAWAVAPLGLPGVHWLAERGYELFARWRVPLGRLFTGESCDTHCSARR